MTETDVPARSGELAVRPVDGWLDTHRFIRFPHELYAEDPHFRAPPDLMRWEQLTEWTNPWFDHGEAQLFLARRGGEVVGRISAQVDREHLRHHDDGAGFFGFFEVEDDPEAARALLERAQRWCGERGMERIRGPFSFSINEESGLLVDGFEWPNYVMMPQGRPYYPELVEGAGFEKAKDLYAWRFDREEMPQRVQYIAEDLSETPELEIRGVDMGDLHSEVETIMDIFNDAWSDNWGFVPLTEAEVEDVAGDFQYILDPELCLIAEVDGEPAGMAVALPNIHEACRDLRGRLFPGGWARLLYRMTFEQVTSFRCILLGIRDEYRGTALGGLSILLYATIHDRAYDAGYEEAEAGWTLEENDAINDGMEFMGAEHYKTYRIYEKEL